MIQGLEFLSAVMDFKPNGTYSVGLCSLNKYELVALEEEDVGME